MTVRTYQSKYGLSINMDLGNIISILATPYYSLRELKNTAIFNPNAIDNQGDVLRFLVEEADIRNYGVDYQVLYTTSWEKMTIIAPIFQRRNFLMK